jgi:hypothetical protein
MVDSRHRFDWALVSTNGAPGQMTGHRPFLRATRSILENQFEMPHLNHSQVTTDRRSNLTYGNHLLESGLASVGWLGNLAKTCRERMACRNVSW